MKLIRIVGCHVTWWNMDGDLSESTQDYTTRENQQPQHERYILHIYTNVVAVMGC